MMSGGSNISKSKLRIIIVDENRDITHILAGMFGLKGFEVYKAYSTEECLNKVNELDGKVETDKTRVLEYGADEFTVKPVSAESIIDKVYSSLLTREHK